MNQNDTLAQAYLFFQHGKYDAAHALLQPLAQAPGADLNLLHLAGAAAAAVGLHGEAVRCFRRALESAPGDVAISYKLARVLVDAGQRQEALHVYLELLLNGVEHADVYHAAAVLLYEFGRDQEALQTMQKALQLAPQSAQAAEGWYLLAVLQTRLKQLADALPSLQRAVALAPAQHRYQQDLALALHGLHRDEEALAVIDQALALNARSATCWNARAVILSRLCRYDESIAASRRVLGLNPEDADGCTNLALTLLTLGEMDAAWPLYEKRWQGALADPLRHQQIVRWNGQQALRGKRILLWFEQGFGDTIQFCRYALEVAAQDAAVVLEVPAHMQALLRTLVASDRTLNADAITVLAQGEPLPPVDYQAPLMSLPLLFETRMPTIPAHRGYLSSDPLKQAQWAEVLAAESAGAQADEPRLRIGIACSGNAGNRKDGLRSIPLASFAPLLEGIDADFFLLQPDLRQDDHAYLQQSSLLYWPGRHLQGFDDTAALIANLDLVISVDTAVAHLAGALAVPVWVLLAQSADWRWFRERSDSPWYPSARLFRQAQRGNWDALIAQVQAALLGGLSAETAG